MDLQKIEKTLIGGDLSALTIEQRLSYYKSVCESLGLNQLTKPFEFIELPAQGGGKKLVLYALKGATDQLRQLHGVSISEPKIQHIDDIVFVSVTATDKTGRQDADTGAVSLLKEDGSWQETSSGKKYFKKNGKLIPLLPDEKCNAVMKAITKAKRRVTLSICGLGMLDETEIETIPTAQAVPPLPIGLEEKEAAKNPPEPPPPTIPKIEPITAVAKTPIVQEPNYWYEFSTLNFDAKKLAIAEQLALKQHAYSVEENGRKLWAATNYLEPRKNFDQFLIEG
jgi:hypothetical protein